MFPTDHEAPKVTGQPRVASLDAHRSRHRLDHLLEVRSSLSRNAAERRSHGLADGEDAYRFQLAVELTIRDEFPNVFDERFSDWTAQDERDSHPVGVLTPACGICESIAAERRVNLVPPEAA
jgi:hypothetical protein